MKHLAIKRTDGGISIMCLMDGQDAAAEVAKWAAGSNLTAVEYREVNPATDIPGDRTFRNAWELNAAGKVKPAMGKARGIWRDCIRTARKPKLAALDVEHLRANETGDAVRLAEVIAQKQALRDAPQDPRIDTASTPEELKAVVPAGLEGAL